MDNNFYQKPTELRNIYQEEVIANPFHINIIESLVLNKSLMKINYNQIKGNTYYTLMNFIKYLFDYSHQSYYSIKL